MGEDLKFMRDEKKRWEDQAKTANDFLEKMNAEEADAAAAETKRMMMEDRKRGNAEKKRFMDDAKADEALSKGMLDEIDSRIQYYIDLNDTINDTAEQDKNWE